MGKYGRRIGERLAVLDHRRGLVRLTLAVGCAPGGLDGVCILQLLIMFWWMQDERVQEMLIRNC